MQNSRLTRPITTAALCMILSLNTAFAQDPTPGQADDLPDSYYGDTQKVNDPLETFNRGVFKFNEVVDKAVMRPIAKGYTAVVPQYGRQRVHNVLVNLG